MHYILIIAILFDGGAVTATEFNDQASCMVAKENYDKRVSELYTGNYPKHFYTSCEPKGADK